MLQMTHAITVPLDPPELGTDGENAAHTSIFLGNEHLDVSLGRAAVPKPGSHEPETLMLASFGPPGRDEIRRLAAVARVERAGIRIWCWVQ